MATSDLVFAGFTISEVAKREFTVLRRAFDEHSPADPAAVLMVGWGLYHLNDGKRFERVVVSYYSQSQYEENKHGIQTVSGVDLIFFIIPPYDKHFEGKVLDHSEDRSFFLRDP